MSGFERSLTRPNPRPLTWCTYGVFFATVSPLVPSRISTRWWPTNGVTVADRLDPVADLGLAVVKALDLDLDLRRLRARVGRVAASGRPVAAAVSATAAVRRVGEREDREQEHGDRRQHPRGDLGELHGAKLWQTDPSRPRDDRL